MTRVLEEIERQKRLEQARVWDQAEAELAAEVSKTLEIELARGDKVPGAVVEAYAEANAVEELTWQTFVDFCNKRNVRRLPAKPSTIAAFLLYGGLSHERMLEALTVITRMHDKHGLSNPTATAIVRTVLELSIEERAPRSWKKEEQELWVALPADIRFTLSRRQRDFDKEVRRVQGELGRVNGELDKMRKDLNAKIKTEELDKVRKRLNAESKTENGLGESHPQLTG
jgi:hypothetical protein